MLSALVKQTKAKRESKVRALTVQRSKVSRGEIIGAKTLLTAEMTEEVLRQRRSGLSVEQIAKAQGRTPHEVSKIIKNALQAIREEYSESLADVKDLELARLDELMEPFYKRAAKGDAFALDRIIKIMERRAKYLGIDSAQKLEHSGEVIKQYIGIDVSKV